MRTAHRPRRRRRWRCATTARASPSMAERAEEPGGTFALVSSGTGTVVRAVFPRTAGT